jgi:phage-related protein
LRVKTLAGKNPKELGLLFLRNSQVPILPTTHDRFFAIPGLNGALDYGADVEPRIFNLECAFNTKNPYDLQKHVERFARVLVGENGKPKTVNLIFYSTKDKEYFVRYSGALSISRVAGQGKFMLPVIAFNPFSRLIERAGDIDSSSLITWDHTYAPDDKYSFTLIGPATIEVNNFGTLEASPLTRITGSFTNLTIQVGDKIFSYNQPLLNDVLEINHELMTAKVGLTNVLKHSSGDFISLNVGYNDVIIGGTDLNITIDFDFYPRFI